jgi:membrane protease YdiL (CAAX protease family)
MGWLARLWSNLIGDWQSSLKYQILLTLPLAVIFGYVYIQGYYPSDAKTLQDRGWHQGIFLTRLGFIPYIFFYLFVMAPVQEFLFRKVFIDFGMKFLDDDNFWIINIVQASVFALLRIIYPYPLGIMILCFVMGIMYGNDYKNNRSLIILSIFHFILAMMAITVNLI